MAGVQTEYEPVGGAKRRSTTGVTPEPIVAVEDAQKSVQGLPGQDHDNEGVNGVKPEHAFSLDYTDPRGHKWTGSFRCHVLTIDERTQVGLTRARLLNGVAPILLDGETLDILEMRAHLAVALDEGPEWAERIGKFRDVNVLGAIYREVRNHETIFWGAEPPETG